MKKIISYCIHCGVEYYYQASGWHPPKNNDPKYCPDCKDSIMDTLSKIPVKFDRRLVETDDLTKEQALEILKKYDEELKGKREDGIIVGTRVLASLVNQKTGEQSIDRIFNYNGNEYYIHYWESEPDNYEIKKKVRWDILNNKEV
jgi:hypothetical protein|tara:strand:- start:26609 stop:27043 length:435 start_codon:yes stop_codon:yes gene_type:complete